MVKKFDKIYKDLVIIYIMMTTITINKCVYKVHPIYNLYGASEDGYIINIIKQMPHRGNKNHTGYFKCRVREHGQSGFKTYYVHRFKYECHNGIIPDDKEIDHINEDKEDNRLCNLQLVTHQQNCKKAAENRDHSSVVNSHKNRKCVKAVDKDTKKTSYFFSIYAAQQHLSIDHTTIKKVCEGHYGLKSGKSKKDGHSYTFECVKQEDLPDDHIKSKNIRPRKASDEEKRKHQFEWQNRKYECPKCGKIIKNFSKYKHNKKCLT